MSLLCREVRATHDLKCLWLSCLVIFAIFSDVLLTQAAVSAAAAASASAAACSHCLSSVVAAAVSTPQLSA